MEELKNSLKQASKFNFELLKRIIAHKTGIRTNQDEKKIEIIILERMKQHNFTVKEYECYLNAETAESAEECRILSLLLTSSETFFFRDPGLFSLLKNLILPELIEQQKEKKILRLWSAGCSSGEEAYSLAILLTQILPEYQRWKIFILGTDINATAIEKAELGIYNRRSFRYEAYNLQSKYFDAAENGWQLKEDFRQMVRFQTLDLINDPFPDPFINNVHLILCRNVFIYFNHDAVSQIVTKFTHTLCDNGYLVTGHGELLHQVFDKQLELKIFPQAFIYKKTNKPILPAKKQKKSCSVSSKSLNSPKNLEHAQALFDQGDYQNAILEAQQLVHVNQCASDAEYLTALAYANLGEYENTVKHCNLAIHLNSLIAKPYYLLSQVAELQRNHNQAKMLLKKVIYLAPDFIAAYLNLANIYEHQDEHSKAHKLRQEVIKILRSLPKNQKIDPYDICVSELLEYIILDLAL